MDYARSSGSTTVWRGRGQGRRGNGGRGQGRRGDGNSESGNDRGRSNRRIGGLGQGRRREGNRESGRDRGRSARGIGGPGQGRRGFVNRPGGSDQVQGQGRRGIIQSRGGREGLRSGDLFLGDSPEEREISREVRNFPTIPKGEVKTAKKNKGSSERKTVAQQADRGMKPSNCRACGEVCRTQQLLEEHIKICHKD